MPAKGYRVVSVKEKAYNLANRIAEEEGRSIADVVS